MVLTDHIPARYLLTLVLLLAPTRADEIVTIDGTSITRTTIKKANAEVVVYQMQQVTVEQRLDAERVRRIRYTRNRPMKQAQDLMDQGRWREAIPYFQKAAAETALQEPAAFGVAEALYRLSETTGADSHKAIKTLEAYLATYREKKGFYVPAALALLGEAHVNAGSLDKAESTFTELAGFSGDTRRLGSQLGLGLVHMARKMTAKAATIFNTVLRQARRANLAEIYRQAAAYRGRALVAEKRLKEAITFLEEHLKSEGAVLDRSMAQAYNALGDAYQAAGGTENRWEALYRYLWTTVIFRTARRECAEAFVKAVDLSRRLGEGEEADRLHAIFMSEFGDTVWAKRATG